jgi:hypothetical protein
MLALLIATRGNSVSKSFRVRTVSAVESDTREGEEEFYGV